MPSEAISEKIPSIAGTMWMDGYGIMSRCIEVLIELPPDALLNRHRFHGLLLMCIRKHLLPIKQGICGMWIVPSLMWRSGLSAWKGDFFDCLSLVQ